jgi:hypothetical protein
VQDGVRCNNRAKPKLNAGSSRLAEALASARERSDSSSDVAIRYVQWDWTDVSRSLVSL